MMEVESNVSNMNVVMEKLSWYGVGRKPPNDEFFKECPVTSVYNEPISLTDLYPEDYQDFTIVDAELSCQVPGCTVVSNSIKDYESHYNLAHRHMCGECKKRLPTAHLLDLHIQETHDSFFAVLSERKPSFACYVQECAVKSKTPEERHKHCVEDHKFPANFKYDAFNKTKHKAETRTNNKNKKTSPNRKSVDISDVNSDVGKAQVKFFSFGHSQTKSFQKPWHAKKSGCRNIKSNLESDKMMVDLEESVSELCKDM